MTVQIVFPKLHSAKFSPDIRHNRDLFFNRMYKRKLRHGENWRQVWVDCGGMCIRCNSVDFLEFHEPFGESEGWERMQSRVLLCVYCHCQEHPNRGTERNTSKTLNDDVQIEIWMHGGYDQWIKDFNLQDTFGRLLYA